MRGAYQYPDEVVPNGHTPTSYLRQITYEGAGRRWPAGMPANVQTQIEHELDLIKDLAYEHYFLTVPSGDSAPHPAVRLGLRMIAGLAWESAGRIVKARAERPFDISEDLARRAELELHEMKLLAVADALLSLSGHRRQQVWDAAALRSTSEILRDATFDEDILELPPAPEGEEVVFDYASLGLTLRTHPMKLLRPRLVSCPACIWHK